MPVSAIEGIVENGRIRLPDDVLLPEKARVLVIIDAFAGPATVSAAAATPRLRSPRLAHPEQARDFRKQVVEAPRDARL